MYYICDRRKKVEHCRTHCYHGRPHEADKCTTEEICNIGSKKGVIVKCRPCTKNELKQHKEKDGEIVPIKSWGK